MATPANYFNPVMTQLTGNTSGNVEQLPAVTLNGGRERVAGGQMTMASQVSGSVISMARLPIGSIITGLTLIVSATLGTSTLAIGDVNNATLYAAAATYTSPNSPTKVGNAAIHFSPITSGWDSGTGVASSSYEDVVLTVGAATLPASGTITLIIEYVID